MAKRKDPPPKDEVPELPDEKPARLEPKRPRGRSAKRAKTVRVQGLRHEFADYDKLARAYLSSLKDVIGEDLTAPLPQPPKLTAKEKKEQQAAIRLHTIYARELLMLSKSATAWSSKT